MLQIPFHILRVVVNPQSASYLHKENIAKFKLDPNHIFLYCLYPIPPSFPLVPLQPTPHSFHSTNTPHFITITRRTLVEPCGQSHVYRSFPSIFSHQTYLAEFSKISRSNPSRLVYILLAHSTRHPASLRTLGPAS